MMVIGLVGEKGGGKGAFTELLKQLLPNLKFAYVRFSDVLTDTLKVWDINPTRENYQKLSVAMRNAFGEGSLTRATHRRVSDVDADIVILDGIRWQADAALLRSLPNNVLVYITADAQIRYERSKTRKEKIGEDQTTFEQFMAEEKAETEKLIPEIGKTANVIIQNNGSKLEFLRKIKIFRDTRLPF